MLCYLFLCCVSCLCAVLLVSVLCYLFLCCILLLLLGVYWEPISSGVSALSGCQCCQVQWRWCAFHFWRGRQQSHCVEAKQVRERGQSFWTGWLFSLFPVKCSFWRLHIQRADSPTSPTHRPHLFADSAHLVWPLPSSDRPPQWKGRPQQQSCDGISWPNL